MNKPRERTRQRGRQMGWVLVLVTAQRFAPLNIFSTLDTSWSHFCLGCLFFSDVTQQLLEHNTASHGLFPEIFLEIFLLLEKHSCLNFFFLLFSPSFLLFLFSLNWDFTVIPAQCLCRTSKREMANVDKGQINVYLFSSNTTQQTFVLDMKPALLNLVLLTVKKISQKHQCCV